MSNYHELFRAVINNDIAKLREILERNPMCVNEAIYQRGGTPLHSIYERVSDYGDANNRLPMIHLLLGYGADINSQINYYYRTPLQFAITKNQFIDAKLFLERGANPNLRDYKGLTALHYAMRADDENIVLLLIQYGAEIDAVDRQHKTSLMYACEMNKLTYGQLLVNVGANVNIKSVSQESALYYACKNRNLEMIEFLIRNRAETNVYNDSWRTALHALALTTDQKTGCLILHKTEESMEKRAVKLLTDQNADINAQDNKGNTALHIASSNVYEHLTLALIEAGANINIKNNKGYTSLHSLLDSQFQDSATTNDDEEDVDDARDDYVNNYYYDTIDRLIRVFIRHGADLRAVNAERSTAFQIALNRGNTNVIKLLLAGITGVDENTLEDVSPHVLELIEDIPNGGFYELAAAALCGYEEVVHRLIDMGYDVEAKNVTHLRSSSWGIQPPIYYAFDNHQYYTAKILLEAGSECYNVVLNQSDDEYNEHERLAILAWKYSTNIVTDEMYNNSELLKEYLSYPISSNNIGSIIDFEMNLTDNGSNKLINSLIFCYIAELISTKMNITLELEEMKIFDHEQSPVFIYCSKVLNELKKISVCDSLTQYDVLTMKLNSLVSFLNCKENFVAYDNYRSNLKFKENRSTYDNMILECLNLAFEKRIVLNYAKHKLNYYIEDVMKNINYSNLPDEIVYIILGYLSVRELKKFVQII